MTFFIESKFQTEYAYCFRLLTFKMKTICQEIPWHSALSACSRTRMVTSSYFLHYSIISNFTTLHSGPSRNSWIFLNTECYINTKQVSGDVKLKTLSLQNQIQRTTTLTNYYIKIIIFKLKLHSLKYPSHIVFM